MEKWKVAAYVRLSSDDGDKAESNSITNQKSLINLFLKNNSDLKLKDFYIDDGFTGTDFNRPDFQRLLNDMKNGKINAILVKDLSRLGRNYIEVGNYLEQIFPLYNIRFIAINDNVDSFKDPNSVSNVIVPFKNLMNDEYARDISNKVRSVLDTKKVNGEFIGSVAPYGYLKDPNNKHKFIIDKKAATIVRKIFKMILNGKSKREVVEELNELGILPPALYKIEESTYNYKVTESMKTWSTKKLDKILKNQSYTGDLVQGKRKKISHKIHKNLEIDMDDWIIVPNHHKALVTKEEFEQVQNIIYNRDIRIQKNNEYDLFSGHIKCEKCGCNLILRKSKGYEYYYCSSYLYKKSCSSHACAKKKLEKDILDVVNQHINLIVDIDKKIECIVKNSNVNYDLEILNNRLEENNKKIDKYKLLNESLKDDLANDFITTKEYNEYKKEYADILLKLKKETNELEDKIEKIDFKSEQNREWIDKFKVRENINELSKTVIDELIDNIIVNDDKSIMTVFKYEDKYFEASNFINEHKCDII